MYFLSEWFGDRRWWAYLGIRIWAGMFLADAVSGMAGKRLFGGVIIFSTAPLLIIAVIIYYVHRRRIDRFNKAIDDRLPGFHQERRQWVLNSLNEDPHFQTHCYRCRHVNTETLACSLHLPNRIKTVILPGREATPYCLYWNLTDETLLLKDDAAKR